MADHFRRFVASRLSWLGLSQTDLAAIAGIDKSSLSRSLRADRPRDQTVLRILHVLGFPDLSLQDVERQASNILTLEHPADRDATYTRLRDSTVRYRTWFMATFDASSEDPVDDDETDPG